jgi:hypothetical protein
MHPGEIAHKRLRATILLAIALTASARSVVAALPESVPASGQAISLFVSDALRSDTLRTDGSGVAVTFAASGSLQWDLMVPTGGKFRVRLAYAAYQSGTEITFKTQRNSISLSLPSTQGFFETKDRAEPRGPFFPNGLPDMLQRNYERVDIGIVVSLEKGHNVIILSVRDPSPAAGFSISSVELLSVSLDPEEDARRAAQQRADPTWLMNAGYGLMFHWTSQTMPRSGKPLPYKDAVDAFDVGAFVHMIEKTGATYVIFTANHQDPHFPAPLKEWEIAHPGWTTKRDLIGEIADALGARGIKLVLYLNTPGMGGFSTPEMDKLPDPSEQLFVDTVLNLVTEIGNRYGTRISGYWLDSFNYIDSKYPEFPFERFFRACKAGNPQRLIALNTWILPVNTMWQDYWAGEVVVTGNPPTSLPLSTGSGSGLPFQALLALYGGWVHAWPNTPIKPPIFSIDELSRFIKNTKGKGAVTLNTGIYQDGTIGDEQTKYFEKLRQSVYGR